MSYCTVGEKATVYYRFGNESKDSIITFDAPIDVTTGNDSGSTTPSQNYDPNGYQIQIYSTNNSITYYATVIDYYITGSGSGEFAYTLYIKGCGETTFRPTVNVDPTTLIINKSINCGGANPIANNARISVLKNGNVVWSATGKAPVMYHVACGNACPDGYCKCHTDSYPGYCCLDCASVSNRIQQITNTVKGLING